jgi:hypothetical protein
LFFHDRGFIHIDFDFDDPNVIFHSFFNRPLVWEGEMIMGVMDRIASALAEQGDQPNVVLAEKLAETEDIEGIHEIGENLWHDDKNIQSDCLKVLYEIGYRKPGLTAGYAEDFLKLLKSKNNRLVWGAMIGLSNIARLRADLLFENMDLIQSSIETGSVITIDAGMKTLSQIAAANRNYHKRIFPSLLEKLRSCRPKSVPMYAEFVAEAVGSEDSARFLFVLEKRSADLTAVQLKRVERIKKSF